MKPQPPPRLFLYQDCFIKVVRETPTEYHGYDIFSEKFITISKRSVAIPLPACIKTLLSDPSARIKLASQIYPTRIEQSKALGMSERTIYRQLKVWDFYQKLPHKNAK